MLDIQTYLAAKSGKLLASPDMDMFSYLLGKSQASPTKTITGVPPFTFKSNGDNLIDWSIRGNTGGVGDRTKNLLQVPDAPLSSQNVTFTPNRGTGEIIPTRTGEQTSEAVISYSITLPAGSYIFTCNPDASFSTYDSYVRDGVRTIARDNPNLSSGNNFSLDSTTALTIHHRVRAGTDITNLVFRPMIRLADTTSDFEPYGYKIPISCGGVTTNIFMQSQLMDGDVLTLADTGVDIPTVNGNNTLTVDTTVQPSEMTITYHRGDRKEHYIFHLDPTTAEITYPKGSANADFEPARMTADGFNYGSWENAFFMPKPCMLKSNGKVDYYLDPNDYSKKLDGTASDIADPTYDGNVMMEFPKIWYKFVPTGDDGEGGTFHCSNVKLDDSYECWCNYDANNNEIDHFYVAAYNAVILDGKMRSLSGYALTQENGADTTTGTDEIAAARANNQNGIDEWYIYLLADHQLLTYLATLMCKHVNHQTKYGRGIDSGSTATKRAYVTGTLNDKGLFWGDASTGTQGVKIFGIENFYACVWKRTAGLIGTSTGYAYKLTHGTKDGSTATSFNTSGSGYKTLARTKPVNGWITTMHHESNGFWIPATTGTNRYDCYYYAGNGYALVGGGPGNGSDCGSWFVHLSAVVSRSDWNFSSALSCKPRAK